MFWIDSYICWSIHWNSQVFGSSKLHLNIFKSILESFDSIQSFSKSIHLNRSKIFWIDSKLFIKVLIQSKVLWIDSIFVWNSLNRFKDYLNLFNLHNYPNFIFWTIESTQDCMIRFKPNFSVLFWVKLTHISPTYINPYTHFSTQIFKHSLSKIFFRLNIFLRSL